MSFVAKVFQYEGFDQYLKHVRLLCSPFVLVHVTASGGE